LTFAVCRITFPLVLRSFRNRALRRYFETGDPSGLKRAERREGRAYAARARRRGSARATEPAGLHWHALQGVERWAIRVTGDWRITFGGMAPMMSPLIWRTTIDAKHC
jgi:toxin HigB-1